MQRQVTHSHTEGIAAEGFDWVRWKSTAGALAHRFLSFFLSPDIHALWFNSVFATLVISECGPRTIAKF